MRNESNIRTHQKGMTMIEVLAAMSILALVALATAGNTITAFKANKRTQISNILHNLAIAKIEEFAGMDVAQIDVADGGTESAVTTSGTQFTFRRVTAITIDANQARTVSVTVTCNDPTYASVATYSATFALWE